MGHRPRPAASSDAYTRPLFWLLLLCAIPIVVSQADNQTSNVSEVPSQDPPSSTASPPIVPCGGSRPFLCYAYQGLDQPFPEWLQQTEQKCQRCVASKNCGPNSQIGGQEDGNRLTVLSSCTPPFCKAEGNTSEAKVCVKAVNFDGKQPGKVFFPFNLCSREMRICWNRTEPVTRNDNSLKPSDEWLPYWQYWAPSVLSVIVCGCGVYWWVRSGRTVALPLPADYKAASVTLETENITGSWLEPFDQRITSKPERRKRGRTIRFADEGHVALYVDPEAVPKAPVKPSATPPTASTAQQGAADQIVPPVTCADPADPSAVAKNILQIFAADTWMQKQESDVKRKEPLVKFDSAELLVLFNRATEIVGEHRGVVRIQGPVWFVGDLRNNLEDTWRIFKAYSEKADPATKMLFLGNVRDAAFKGLTSLSIIVASIVLYPKSVFYLCGQFEASDVQCSSHAALDTSIATFFANLPLFAIIDDRILSMHGGLGPELKPEDIRKGFEPTSTRATELRLDTLQSDPNCLVKDCAPKNDKTKGYFYGLTAIDDARRKFRIDYIIRARQATNLGLRFFGRWLISLFSTQQTTDQLTAVLQYGANSTFTALYLTKLGERYETQGVFEQKFDYQASTDRVFVDMDAVALSASPSTDLKTGENAPDPKTPKDA
ncbi:unnamed protein product, partial [Mesorhabditis spiculigera]